ncbi:MAG: hypothetical protein AAFV53_08725 [Myxococcota bacterium]
MPTPQTARIQTWLIDPSASLPSDTQRSFLEQLIPAVQAWQQWMDEGGLDALIVWAQREAPDGMDGAEVASETWLDVHDRLAHAVERFQSDRSLPRFSTVEEVARYHGIQLRLRLQGRWRRRPAPTVSIQAQTLIHRPRITEQVEARRKGLVLGFAGCWFAEEHRSGRSQKSPEHWWQMLRMGLDLIEGSASGAQRNDVTEAVDRLRFKLYLLSPLRSWLRASGWTVTGLPQTPPKHPAVRPLMTQLRPSMTRALASLDGADSAERRALGAILQGATVRTRLASFGTSPNVRRPRLWALAAEIGARVAAEMG